MQKHQDICGNIIEINQLITSGSKYFKFKSEVLDKTANTSTVNVEAEVSLKYK